MARNQGRAEDAPALLLGVDAGESLVIAIEHSAVHFVEAHGESRESQALISSLLFEKADVGDFRIGVRAPRDDQSTRLLTTEEERVLQNRARHGIRGMRELVDRTDIAGGVNVRIRGA